MNKLKELCINSLFRLLRPIARFSLKHSLKHRDIVEYLKITLVQVAKEELESLDLPSTPSKISVMTGIQRKEVSRILVEGPEAKTEGDVISRIIGLWQNGKQYKDKYGRPKVLELAGREGEFANLVSSISTDLNPYTVAFELERSGLAKQTPSGIKLIKPGYEPSSDDVEESLKLLGQDSELLYHSVLENVFSPKGIKNVHVKTYFDNIPESMEDEIRAWFLNQGNKFHEEARAFLSERDRDLNPKIAIKYPTEKPMTASICSFSSIEKKK